MADAIVQILMKAKNDASKEIKTVAADLNKSQTAAAGMNKSMNSSAFQAGLTKAALLGLAGVLTIMVGELSRMENELTNAAKAINNVSNDASGGVGAIVGELKSLVTATGATAKDAGESLLTVKTAFNIFDVKDEKGIAALLIDWKRVTGEAFESAGKNFRETVLVYFGAGSDLQKVLPEAADKILATAKAIHTDPASLSKAIANGGAIFKNAFGDLDNVLMWVGSLGAAGGDVEATSEAIKHFIEQVNGVIAVYKAGGKVDDKTKAAFAALGLSVETVQNEAIAVGDKIMLALKNAMKDGKLSDAEIAALNFLFGDKIGVDLALASGKIEGFQTDVKTALAGYKGTLEQAAKDTKTNVDKVAQSWNSLLATIGSSSWWNAIQATVSAGLDALNKALETPPTTESDNQFVDKYFGAVPDVTTLLPGFQKWAADTWAAFQKAISDVWYAKKPSDAELIANAQTLLTPDTAVLIPGFNTWAANAWAGFKKSVSDAWTTTTTFWSGIWVDVQNAAGSAWGDTQTYWENLASAAWDWMAQAWSDVIKGSTGITNWATGTASSITDGFKPWLTALTAWSSQVWDVIKAGVKVAIDGAEGVTAWALNTASSITDGLGKWLSPVETWAAGIWDAIKAGVGGAINGTVGVIAWAKNRAADIVKGLGEWLSPVEKWAAGVWDSIKSGMGAAINGAEGIGAWALNRAIDITNGLGKWLEPVTTWAAKVWDSIKTGVGDAITGKEGVVAWALNTSSSIVKGLGEWLAPVAKWAEGIWDSIKTGFGNAFNGETGVIAWAANRWTDFRNQFGAWWTGLVEVGGNLLKGLLKGMGDAWKSVEDAITKIGGDVLKTFKAIFGIKSPSLELKTIGDFLIQGLIEGLQGAYPEVMKLVTDISNQILSIWNDGQPRWNEFGTFISNKIKEWGKDLTGFGKMATNVFASFAQFLGGEAANGFKDFGSHLKEFLGQMITGLEVQIATQSAAGIATAVAQAPLTLGASLLAIPAIVAEAALELAALEGGRAIINSFAVGTPYVTQDQLAQIHKGEMIVPRTMAEGVRNGDVSLGGGSNQPIIVQVLLDGRVIQENVSNRTIAGVRNLVRDNLGFL